MTEELFPYYNSELAFLRQLGKEFALEHPTAAWALGLGENSNEANRDPHVERLLQGVAFLNARIRHRLEDDFPELSESLLNILYPYYLTPFPSCAIAEMNLNIAQIGKDAASGRLIPKESSVEYSPQTANGAPLQFRTAYPTQLVPIRVANARFLNERFESPAGTRPREANAALHVELETLIPEIQFSDLAEKCCFPSTDNSERKRVSEYLTIRFFLHGQAQTVHSLLEQFLRSTLRVVGCSRLDASDSFVMPAAVVSAVGFRPEDQLLPQDGRVLPGFQLLHEYFAFPAKFHFIDISIPRAKLKNIGTRLHLLFMTRDEDENLAAMVSQDSLRLGSTPIINLFERRTSLTHDYREPEHRLIVDSRFPLDYEIFSVKRVTATTSSRSELEYRSFYDIYHSSDRKVSGFWHTHRRYFGSGASAGEGVSDVYLSLVDHVIRPDTTEDATVSVDLICMNRNIESQDKGSLARSNINKSLMLTGGDFGARAEILIRPTPIQRRSARNDWRWRFCSHLALNHLTVTNRQIGANGLKETLKLYNISELSTVDEKIEGLISLETRQDRITRRVAEGPHAFARGIEVTLTFREAAYSSDNGLFLFASIIAAYLANFCNFNSFVETVIRSSERDREIHRWPAMSGTRPIL